MLFNSLTFPVFFVTVLTIHWSLTNQRWRNSVLLFASFFFYGCWDYRFLGLLLLSAGIDYFCALFMSAGKGPRRLWLGGSLASNLGIFGIFKYYNFFSDSLRQLLDACGWQPSWPVLHVILPVGISFYTFQALSYTIDVYRGKTDVCKDPLTYLLYVCFFPQLVAGPIEQSSTLMPQFRSHKTFDPDLALFGLRSILWGVILKCVVADNLAPLVNRIYGAAEFASAPELLLGTYCFAFQIYGDFAGYTLIAIGTAALLGVRLRQNFRSPYLSTSVQEFWTRWHISLTAWFREYVYIWLLGGSRVSAPRRIFNVLATFAVSGLWHGANWTYVLWGLLNGTFYFVGRSDPERPVWRQVLSALATFHLICVGWVFFRAKNLMEALTILRGLATPWRSLGFHLVSPLQFVLPGLLIIAVIAAEVVQRLEPDVVAIGRLPRPYRLGLYYALLIAFVLIGEFSRRPFIYFQF